MAATIINLAERRKAREVDLHPDAWWAEPCDQAVAALKQLPDTKSITKIGIFSVIAALMEQEGWSMIEAKAIVGVTAAELTTPDPCPPTTAQEL